MDSLENLARTYFALVDARDRRGLTGLLHPEVSVSLSSHDDFRGREIVMKDFYAKVFAWTLYEPTVTSFEPLPGGALRARGRLRWMSNGELRDAPAAWTLEFEDGQLYRLSTEAPLLAAQLRSRRRAGA